jgi:hypothetical protein
MHLSSIGDGTLATLEYTEPQANPVRLARVFGVRELPDGPGAADAAIKAAFNQRSTRPASIGAASAVLLLTLVIYNLYANRRSTRT